MTGSEHEFRWRMSSCTCHYDSGIVDWTDPACPYHAPALNALRDEVDPGDDNRCGDCDGELEDGNYTLICRECADVDD